MCDKCSILFFDPPFGPIDSEGCYLPNAHNGPHEFKSKTGKIFQWENDYECDCEDLDECECIVYWEKK